MTPDQLKELERLNERWANDPKTCPGSIKAEVISTEVMDLLPDVIAHIKELTAERDAAQKACAYYLLACDSILITILENEDVFKLFGNETIVGILRTQKPGEISKAQAVQGLCLQTSEGTTKQPRNPEKTGNTLACKEVQESREVSQIHQGLCSQSSGEVSGGLFKERSIQSKVPDDIEKCGCEREDFKAKNVSRMWMERMSTCASQRLQQAIQSRVAMQHLSREEAQEILNALSTDCGKGYHHDDEWKPVLMVLKDIATDDLDRVSGGVKQSAQQALAHAEKLMER